MTWLNTQRFLYSALFYLLLPFIFLRLLWRSRRNLAYRQHWGQRLGFSTRTFKQSIWLHAVSVGESLAAVSLIKQLRRQYPTLPIVVTTMTPTGAARIDAALGASVTRVYFPYDLPSAVRRFLRRVNPLVAILMETELWPNMLAACEQAKVPVLLANARLSERSLKGYLRFPSFTQAMLSSLTLIMAQTAVDAARFKALGAKAEQLQVTGNIKFDLELPANLKQEAAALRASLGRARPIWVAASTHPGEEELVLRAHQRLREREKEALLILVPRHPERFNTVAALVEREGFSCRRRSLGEDCLPETAVFLGDTMGELLLFYAAADLAFVGGSFAAIGGHNLLEPAALAKPIITGPQLFNFTEIAELLTEAEALIRVVDAKALSVALVRYFSDLSLQIQDGERARQVLELNRGALTKHLAFISAILAAHKTIMI